MALQGAASDYYNMPEGQRQVGGIFSDLTPGAQPFLGGSAQASNAYLGGVAGQQQHLQTLQNNAMTEPVAAPLAQYSGSLQGTPGITADTLQAQGQLSYLQGQHAYLGAQNAVDNTGTAFQGAQDAYGRQVGATGLAESAALGRQPSVAELTLGRGIGAAARSQLSAAASTRGGAAMQSAAGQTAAVNAAGIESAGINEAAQLRASEMATARGQYLGATQANTGTAQAQTQAALARAAAQQQQVGLSNQTTGLSLQQQAQAAAEAQFQAQQQIQQNQLNNNLSLGYGQQGLGYGQLGLSGMQSQLAADTANQQQMTQARQAGNQATTNFIGGLVGAGGSLLSTLSDVRSKQDIQQVSGDQIGLNAAGNAAKAFGAGIQGESSTNTPLPQNKIAPTDAQVAAPQQPQPQAPPLSGMTKDQAMAFLKGTSPPATGPAISRNVSYAPNGNYSMDYGPNGVSGAQGYRDAMAMAHANRFGMTQPQMVQELNDYVPNDASGAMSDKDTKAGAKPAEHVADEYLDHLAKSAATYSYKDPAQAPAQRPAGAKFGGVMAQDLETVPEIGKQLVSDTPEGKTLEGGSNLTAALMGLGRLHERLKALEASRASK